MYKIITSLLPCAFFLYGQSQDMPIDGIAAIVGENIILKSDVSQVVGMTALQRGLDVSKDRALLEKIQEDVLNSLIDQKVILEMAKLDSIEVAEKDIESALEQQIEGFIMRAGTEEMAETMLGQSLNDFRREYWYDMRDRLITEQYQQQLIMSININRENVMEFFTSYKDSLPLFPITMKIRHLLIKIKPSKKNKLNAEKKINTIRDRILAGESFSDLAETYSADPGSKNNGGSLGYIRRNQMVKKFETVAFTQEINTISNPVETTFGFHILETTEKSGEKIKVRHILISPEITEEDETNTYNFAMTLRDSSKSLDSFKKLVEKHSDDEPTKKLGGDLGWINPTNSPIPEIAEVLGLLEKDECSRPVKSDHGYHLLWVEAVKPGGSPSLETHWVEIEEITLNHKRMKYFQEWIVDARTNFFIDIKQ
jgi:peptidyl-prolyl cis-trans isomerase SurA|tara:strand:+ start:2933 stop:4210 length:1278 start_codon:yes stop_codon:yes gene_type:complete